MLRTHTCGELNATNINQTVTLCGWIQKVRKLGGMIFIDLRDRYGITQLAFNNETNAALCQQVEKFGREWVIRVTGTVAERYSKNKNIPTGDIEIIASEVVSMWTRLRSPATSTRSYRTMIRWYSSHPHPI